MAKCVNCGAEVARTEGKRARLYCNDACKKAFARKARLVDNGTKTISGHNRDGITGQSNPNREDVNDLGLTVKVRPDGLRDIYGPAGRLARIEAENGRPLSYERPLVPYSAVMG
jgi:hypothetical protein